MPILEHTIHLKIKDLGIMPVIALPQSVTGSPSRRLKFIIDDAAIGSTYTARIYVEKADKTIIYNAATVNTDGSITVDTTTQMLAVKGHNLAQLQIFETGTANVVSFLFDLFVQGSIIDPDAIESKDEFKILEVKIAEATEAILKANTATTNANNAATNATKVANTINIDAATATDGITVTITNASGTSKTVLLTTEMLNVITDEITTLQYKWGMSDGIAFLEEL